MERVLNSIGPFGRYQKLILVLTGLVSSMTATIIYATVFTSASPKLVCVTSGGDNDDEKLSTCEMWSVLKRNASAPYECSFDTTYYKSTIVTEWGLVCDRSWMVGLTTTLNLAGAVSGMFIGFFSDRFGRKKCALALSAILASTLTIWQLVLYVAGHGLDDDLLYTIYCIVQFVCGAMAKSLYTISYILIFELITVKYATIISNVFSYMYVLGEFMVLGVAYWAPEWHTITLAQTVYALFLVGVIALFLPESPRFLMAMERDERLACMLETIARVNGRVCDTQALLKQEIEFEDVQKKRRQSIIETSSTNKNDDDHDENVDVIIHDKHTAKDEMNFITQRGNIVKIATFVYIWFALSLTYYGVSLGITSLDENLNPYLMFMLGSLAELAGYLLCHLNDRFGRRRMMIAFVLSASVICLVVALLPSSSSLASLSTTTESLSWQSALKIAFASLGKAAISAAYTSCYIFNSMLFPTHVRTTVLVFTTNVGRIGAFISPQIRLLHTLVDSLPYIVFSSASLLAAVGVFLLPDPDKIKF